MFGSCLEGLTREDVERMGPEKRVRESITSGLPQGVYRNGSHGYAPMRPVHAPAESRASAYSNDPPKGG